MSAVYDPNDGRDEYAADLAYDRYIEERIAQGGITQYQRAEEKLRGRALEREHFNQWEWELAQPDYYAYFLEEVTR
jgi:hypothetical protein